MRVGTFIAVSGPTERVEIHRQDSDLAAHTTQFPVLFQSSGFLRIGQLRDSQVIYGITVTVENKESMFSSWSEVVCQIVYKRDNIRRFGL